MGSLIGTVRTVPEVWVVSLLRRTTNYGRDAVFNILVFGMLL